jgi:hypothetical protein
MTGSRVLIISTAGPANLRGLKIQIKMASHSGNNRRDVRHGSQGD